MSAPTGISTPFADELYELARKYQREARELLHEYDAQLPRKVAHFLDDLSIIIPDAMREASR